MEPITIICSILFFALLLCPRITVDMEYIHELDRVIIIIISIFFGCISTGIFYMFLSIINYLNGIQ